MSIIQFTASLPYITSSLSELHSGCKWILPNFLSIILLFSPLGQKMLLFGILYLSLQGCKLSFLFCSFSSEVTSQLWVQNWGSEQGMCIHPSSSAPNVSGGKPSDAQTYLQTILPTREFPEVECWYKPCLHDWHKCVKKEHSHLHIQPVPSWN